MQQRLFKVQHFALNFLSFLNYLATVTIKLLALTHEFCSPPSLSKYFYNIVEDNSEYMLLAKVRPAQ